MTSSSQSQFSVADHRFVQAHVISASEARLTPSLTHLPVPPFLPVTQRAAYSENEENPTIIKQYGVHGILGSTVLLLLLEDMQKVHITFLGESALS